MPASALSERAARLSIRARLLLLVLALGLPFLAYIAIEAAGEARADRELAKERSLAVARVVAARLDDYVGDVNQLLATLSHVAAIGPEHASENDALLRDMQRDLPSYVNNVAMWTLTGTNVGSLDPQTRVKGFSVADRHYFKDAISSRTLSLEAPIVARTNGELVAIFARPVLRGDSVLGVVSASTQLRHMQGFLDREGSLPKDSVITVIDPQGIILARSAETDKWLGKNVSDQPAIRTSLLQGEGLAEGAAVDAVPRLYGYTTARSAAVAGLRRHPDRVGAGAGVAAPLSRSEAGWHAAARCGDRGRLDRGKDCVADAAARVRRRGARRRRPWPSQQCVDRRRSRVAGTDPQQHGAEPAAALARARAKMSSGCTRIADHMPALISTPTATSASTTIAFSSATSTASSHRRSSASPCAS